MIEIGNVYTNDLGFTLNIDVQFDQSQSLGAIYAATLTAGTLTLSLLVTESGLEENGYTLVTP